MHGYFRCRARTLQDYFISVNFRLQSDMRQLCLGIEELRRKLSRMGALVEAAVNLSAQSLGSSDPGLLKTVISGEAAINRLEMEIDDGAICLLALYQPVACDLRFLTATLKMTTDLERMGDLSANIV